MLSDRCPVMSVCPVCNAGVLWPKGRMDQAETWHSGRPRPGHIVLGGDPAPRHAKGHSPQFLAHICCGQMAGCIKMPVGMEVGLGPDSFVFDGDPAPPVKWAEPPIFGPCLLWPNKMPHGMKVGLGSGHIVLDGDPAPLTKKGQRPQICGLFLLWPNGWMHQDATCYGGRPMPWPQCARWGRSSLPKKGAEAPNCWPICIVAKRLYASGYHLVQRQASA